MQQRGQILPLISGLGIPLGAVSQAGVLPSDTPGWKANAVLKMLWLHLPAKPLCDLVCDGISPGLWGADCQSCSRCFDRQVNVLKCPSAPWQEELKFPNAHG